MSEEKIDLHLLLATTGIFKVALVRKEKWEWEMTAKKKRFLGISHKWHHVSFLSNVGVNMKHQVW